MTVRAVTQNDLPAFKRLFCEYYSELDCEDDPLHLLDEYLLPDLKAGLFDIGILEHNGQAVGFVIYQIDDVINDWNFKDGWGDLREIYVSPQCRENGAGKLLLAFAEAELKKCAALSVYVLPTEESEGFFIKCGYADSGEYCPELDNKVFTKNLN